MKQHGQHGALAQSAPEIIGTLQNRISKNDKHEIPLFILIRISYFLWKLAKIICSPKYIQSGQVISIFAVYHSTSELKLNNEYALLYAMRIFTSKSGKVQK